MAPNGMVAASHPLAAQIGLDVLKRGGNAIDAAIAVDAALGLMEPMSCGIGGDLFAIVWDAKTQKLYGLNASGRAPYKATRKFFADQGLDEIPITGPLSWSVPGCVDGWDVLNKRFGSRPLAELLEPVIRYAEDGFPVTEIIGGYWKVSQAKLRESPDAARTYLIDDPSAVRRDFQNPSFAQLPFDCRKAATLYKGGMAKAMVSFGEVRRPV